MTRVAISCGGTGGHIYPALALTEWMKEHLAGVETSFIVSKSENCRRMMKRYKGKVSYIGLRGMPRKASPGLLLFAWSLLRGLVLGVVCLVRERPDVVLGMGGYGSAPLVLAARAIGIPIVIHEQNLFLGRANAFLSRFANRVALSFPSVPDRIDKRKVVVTGNPVRPGIGRWSKEAARVRLGLERDRFTVLAMGGSRGAHFINELAASCASALSPEGFQWIHIAGGEDYGWVSARYSEIGAAHYCAAFVDDIEVLYGASDIAICRAGATTIAELAKCGLPAIFIPYPYAVGSHQSLNAKYLVKRGAGIILEQDEALQDKVGAVISGLRADRERLSGMGRELKDIFVSDASSRLAKVVLGLTNHAKKRMETADYTD